MFVDADVVIQPTTIGHLARVLEADASLWAAFGSYDMRPSGLNLAAQYANLRHHHVHQTGNPEAGTFWAGIGAFRRSAFDTIGGFDERYGPPSIEDIEIGVRAKEHGGRIRIVPEAQGRHLKDWTVRQLWHTDIFRRAAPWTKLLARRKGLASDLNLAAQERWKAVLAYLALFGLAAAPVWPVAGLGFLAAAGTYIALNREFLALLYRRGGVKLLLAGLGLHWAYHLYSSATFALVTIYCRFRSRDVVATSGEPTAPVAARSGTS